MTAWEDAIDSLRLSHPELDTTSLASLPQPSFISLDNPTASSSTLPPDVEIEEPTTAKGKKRKGTTAPVIVKKSKVETNGYYSILRAEELRMPVLATTKEMEEYIIQEQKRVLLEQYGA
jgi:hypothetical protein